MMGGHSKWNVLGDTEISSAMPQVFGGVPEVKAGLCYSDVAAVWRKWNPVFWLGIRLYGYLGETNRARAVTLQERRPAGGLLRRWVTPVLRRLTG
jgi:tRNA(adenine34) deaminase